MKIYRNIDQFIKTDLPIVVTIGTFDGVHLAHKKLIGLLNKRAKELNGQSLLLTFSPHPRKVLNPTKKIQLITPLNKKIELLEKEGLNHLIVHPFDKSFANLSAEEFIKTILYEKLHINEIIVGYNHQFGKNRTGGFEKLKKYKTQYNYNVFELSEQTLSSIKLSSTFIRKSIQEGNIDDANAHLGYYYQIKGIVQKGKQIGREIGFPTANIDCSFKDLLLPKGGAYAVIIELSDKTNYKGMLNIGINPTVSKENKLSIEVNIFDFDEAIYNQEIAIKFVKRLRDELTFGSIQELKTQLGKDKANTLKCF